MIQEIIYTTSFILFAPSRMVRRLLIEHNRYAIEQHNGLLWTNITKNTTLFLMFLTLEHFTQNPELHLLTIGYFGVALADSLVAYKDSKSELLRSQAIRQSVTNALNETGFINTIYSINASIKKTYRPTPLEIGGLSPN